MPKNVDLFDVSFTDLSDSFNTHWDIYSLHYVHTPRQDQKPELKEDRFHNTKTIHDKRVDVRYRSGGHRKPLHDIVVE